MNLLMAISQWLIPLVFLLMEPALTLAEVYYVDGLEGNDASTGESEIAAWKSISRLNSHTFQPGDTILFRRGREWYEVSLKIRARELTIGSYGEGPLPRLIGSVIVSSWGTASNGIYRAHVKQDWGVQLVKEKGGRFYKWSRNMESGLAPGTFYFDKKTQAVYMNPFDGKDPNGRQFIVGNQNHVIELQDNDITRLTIENLEVSYANRYGISPWWQGASAQHGEVMIANCLFIGNAFSAIAFSGKASYESININNNVIRMNGAEGIYIGPYSARTGLLVSDNMIGDQGDGEFGWRGEGPKSAFNGDGIDVKHGNRGVIIQRNTVTHLTGGYGIGILSGGSLVENNIIADILMPDGESAGIYVDVDDKLGLTTIRNNNISGSKLNGIVVRGSAKIHPPVLVEGNNINLTAGNPFSQIGLTSRNNENITIRFNRGSGGGYGIYLYGDSPRNVIIENNLVLHTNTAWWIDPTMLNGLTVKRNSVCRNISTFIEWRTGKKVHDLLDANGIFENSESVVLVPCA